MIDFNIIHPFMGRANEVPDYEIGVMARRITKEMYRREHPSTIA